MASSLRTKLRIAASVLLAPGFFDAVAGRFLFQPGLRPGDAAGTPPLLEREWRDLAGALHIHSTYSDGASDVPTVMEAAKEVGVDFLLLTDHNTQRPRRDGWEARYEEKPLLLIGTEVTVEQGAFLLALDMPPDWEPTRYQPPQVAVDEIEQHGGLPLVSLPFDVKHPWKDWNVAGYAGLEVINLSTIARRHINIPSFVWLTARWRRHGMADVLRTLVTRPDREMATWDALTANGQPFVGIAALDAHALMKIGKKKYPVPSYADSFRATATHVLVPGSAGGGDRSAIYDALRRGRCYMAYDCLADPKGFTFTARSGEREAVMGESIVSDGGCVSFSGTVPTEHDPRFGRQLIRLLRNGRVVAATAAADHQQGFTFTATEPGAYRIEVYRYARRLGPFVFGARPWIFSNPIYVRAQKGV